MTIDPRYILGSPRVVSPDIARYFYEGCLHAVIVAYVEDNLLWLAIACLPGYEFKPEQGATNKEGLVTCLACLACATSTMT